MSSTLTSPGPCSSCTASCRARTHRRRWRRPPRLPRREPRGGPQRRRAAPALGGAAGEEIAWGFRAGGGAVGREDGVGWGSGPGEFVRSEPDSSLLPRFCYRAPVSLSLPLYPLFFREGNSLPQKKVGKRYTRSSVKKKRKTQSKIKMVHNLL